MYFSLLLVVLCVAVGPILSQTIGSAQYINVGKTGTYEKITYMPTEAQQCPDHCIRQNVTSSGPLSPFDGELTLAFRGPMNISRISVYQPAEITPDTGHWTRVSHFKAQMDQTEQDNMVFMNNRGGNVPEGGCSGVWDMCAGNSQSYASENGTTCASSSKTFSGTLPSAAEINIMTEDKCNAEHPCGFSRGVSYHGWKGSSSSEKLFIIEASMANTDVNSFPAIWLLHADVVRTAQYNCNCRGEGFWGGCGELDVAEVLHTNPTMLSTTLYSYQGSIGNDSLAMRSSEMSTFVVIFKVVNNQGVVKVIAHGPQGAEQCTTISADQIQLWMNYQNEMGNLRNLSAAVPPSDNNNNHPDPTADTTYIGASGATRL